MLNLSVNQIAHYMLEGAARENIKRLNFQSIEVEH
jgi:hypothetical protein